MPTPMQSMNTTQKKNFRNPMIPSRRTTAKPTEDTVHTIHTALIALPRLNITENIQQLLMHYSNLKMTVSKKNNVHNEKGTKLSVASHKTKQLASVI